MDTVQPTTRPAETQPPRRSLTFEEYVRLFHCVEQKGKSVFVRYFWNQVETLDHILTPLSTYFGDKLRRQISHAELAEYVAQRRRQGLTELSIHEELSCLAAAVQHARTVGRSRWRRDRGFALPSRKFLKQPPMVGAPAPPTQPSQPVEDVDAARERQDPEATISVTIPAPPVETRRAIPSPRRRSLQEAERDLVLKTLASVRGNKTRAADLLGISVRGLHHKLKRLREQGMLEGTHAEEISQEISESPEPVNPEGVSPAEPPWAGQPVGPTRPCARCRREFPLDPRLRTRYCSAACRIAQGEEALALEAAGVRTKDIAGRLGVPYSTVYYAMQSAREAKQQA